jgi:hypothetical protein
LIGKRLEQVEVPAVDQRHVRRRPCELANGLQASEAAADNHDPVARTPGRARRWNRSLPLQRRGRFLLLGHEAHRRCVTMPTIAAGLFMV